MVTDRDDETVGMATAVARGGHESRDVDLRTVVAVGAGLALLTLAAIAFLFLHVETLWRWRQASWAPPAPVAEALPREPPEPRLQTAPSRDLETLRAEEDARLRGYGWVDRRAGVVRIPIERAIELTVAEAGR